MPGAQAAARQAGGLAGASVPLGQASLTYPRWVLLSAGLSPIVITSGWLIAGQLQPTGYDPVRQTISVLAGSEGSYSWIMTGALYLTCGLYILTAAGLAQLRPSARALLVLAGICSAGIASAPEPASGPTAMHLAWTVLGGITIALWPAFAGRLGTSAPVSVRAPTAVIVTVAFVGLLSWVLYETQGGSELGLAERMASSVPTAWPFVVAIALRRAAFSPLSRNRRVRASTGGFVGREDARRAVGPTPAARISVPRQRGRADQPVWPGQPWQPRRSSGFSAAGQSAGWTASVSPAKADPAAGRLAADAARQQAAEAAWPPVRRPLSRPLVRQIAESARPLVIQVAESARPLLSHVADVAWPLISRVAESAWPVVRRPLSRPGRWSGGR
jgi:hypothetical membrane protein